MDLVGLQYQSVEAACLWSFPVSRPIQPLGNGIGKYHLWPARGVEKLSSGRGAAIHFPPNRLRNSSAGSLMSNGRRSNKGLVSVGITLVTHAPMLDFTQWLDLGADVDPCEPREAGRGPTTRPANSCGGKFMAINPSPKCSHETAAVALSAQRPLDCLLKGNATAVLRAAEGFCE